MLDEYLVKHSSPTLAGIKVGNLFSLPIKEIDSMQERRESLLKFGIDILMLKEISTGMLVYVYRKNMLDNILSQYDVKDFLGNYGYEGKDALAYLKERFERENCPHEVGIFLGYPLGDVKMFIEHKGKNYKRSGLWKVYGDEEKTQSIFDKYIKCTREYFQLYVQGKNITELCVERSV